MFLICQVIFIKIISNSGFRASGDPWSWERHKQAACQFIFAQVEIQGHTQALWPGGDCSSFPRKQKSRPQSDTPLWSSAGTAAQAGIMGCKKYAGGTG